MSRRHAHPALRHRPTCDDDGGVTPGGTDGHDCVCIREPGHATEHGCACGVRWTDDLELDAELEAYGAQVIQLFGERVGSGRPDDEDLVASIEESVVRLTVDELEACSSTEARRDVVRRLIARLREALV